MGIFGFLAGKDINLGVEEYQKTPGAKLIDVRTKPEYAQGHVEHSMNIPLDRIEMIENKVKDKNTPLFVYCQSGARSTQATSLLRNLGYQDVRNIGGITTYKGKKVTS
ncbi:MAG: rhodanese-like domain-containing protein [Erysipelotrichaceae bacterium]|nr:rhodanese-like domain-containing protein [Erysipelotrichaceae bacterium]